MLKGVFEIFALCSYLSLFVAGSGDTGSADGAITINVCATHDAVLNTTACNSAIEGVVTTGDCTCTLRSAVSYCTSHVSNDVAPLPCTIVLPANATLWLNASYGELSITNTSHVIIDGRGSVVTSYAYTPEKDDESVWSNHNCTVITVEMADSFGTSNVYVNSHE